ncbi:MAG: MFS transporter [Candidatus Dormibacteraeota bacterium]|nr:MFS transporter [Candidatus Dormibacteraeota bacterium]
MTHAVWRNRDFALLWSGQTVSEVGSAVTTIALPTLAIFAFHAGPAAVGLMIASERLPFPIVALFAGAIVDRVRRRRVMVGCNLARLAVLALIPLLSATGELRLWELFVAAGAMGVFTVFFDISYMAYVPGLVAPDQILEANSRLQVTWSAAQTVGPGLGGVLVQAAGAARAVLVDALSFLVSSIALLSIRAVESIPSSSDRRHLLTEVGEGLRHVFGIPALRAQLLCLTAAGVFAHAYEAPLYVFAYERLRLSPGLLGLMLSSQGLGAMIGSVIGTRIIRWLGVGPTISLASACASALIGLVPLAVFVAPAAVMFPVFILGGAIGVAGDIAQVTLRQTLTPSRLQGRMGAVFRTFFWGAWPLGNLLGGLLAAAIGASSTLWVTALLGTAGFVAIRFTPLWRIRAFPAAAGPSPTPPFRPDALTP